MPEFADFVNVFIDDHQAKLRFCFDSVEFNTLEECKRGVDNHLKRSIVEPDRWRLV